VTTRLLDASADDAALPLDAQVNVALLIFTLSAVPPERMANVLRLAHASLREGGLLLFRDYALYDLPQLRFEPEARLGKNLYRREDGTLSYFFTTMEIQERAAATGFDMLECTYGCVVNTNRKTGEVLQRVFVHGVFRKT
jgi:methyltransferase-like protein 6